MRRESLPAQHSPIAAASPSVAALLQDIHNVEPVSEEYLGEAVRFVDGVRHLSRLVMLGVAEATGIEDARAQPQFPGGFARDASALIASLVFSAAMVLRAWCSSHNPTTAVATRRVRIIKKEETGRQCG